MRLQKKLSKTVWKMLKITRRILEKPEYKRHCRPLSIDLTSENRTVDRVSGRKRPNESASGNSEQIPAQKRRPRTSCARIENVPDATTTTTTTTAAVASAVEAHRADSNSLGAPGISVHSRIRDATTSSSATANVAPAVVDTHLVSEDGRTYYFHCCIPFKYCVTLTVKIFIVVN